jgi:hypothetical protein
VDFGVQLADFGSAVDVNQPGLNPADTVPSLAFTADVILGLIPRLRPIYGIAVTVAELFLGELCFEANPTTTCCTCLCLGAFPTVSFVSIWSSVELPLPRHFQQKVPTMFMRVTNDPVTGEPVRKMLSLLPQNDNKFPAHTLNQQLLKAKSAKIHELVNRFSDLLQSV